MNVFALLKRFEQSFVSREMGHDPKLDLRVVGSDELVSLGRNKGLPYTASLFAPDGDILQVGFRRGQSTGSSDSLMVGRVYPAGTMVNQLRQRVGVGRLQLAQASVLKNQTRQFVFVGEFLKHRLRC